MTDSPVAVPIRQWGYPGLRQPSQRVRDPLGPSIQALGRQLLASLGQGVGLAAPQIGVNLRVILVASRANDRYPDAPQVQPLVMINPVITERSSQWVSGWEGCLSVPGLRAEVPRAQALGLTYQDLAGCTHHDRFTGFVARIIQHELDHLDGKLFVDHLQPDQPVLTEAQWRTLYPPVVSPQPSPL